MPAQVTTRAQVNGYRFLLRRLEHALIRGDSRMIHDPMRGQMRALVVGLVIGIIITGACGVLAFFKPSPAIGNAQILLTKQDGALYVRIGDRIHPVLNIASARLISGQPDQPAAVDTKKLGGLPVGPMVGIVGAPNAIHGGADMATSHWTVCDSLTTPNVTAGRVDTGGEKLTTSVVGIKPVLGQGISEAGPADMLLVAAGPSTYLIYDGVRARIDLADPVTTTALHIDQRALRRISPGLLNAFPLVEPIKPVAIDGMGEPSAIRADIRVGSIVKVSDSRGEQLFVVLREGVQPVSPATADIIRYGDTTGTQREIRDIPPVLVSTAAVVHTLPVDRFPRRSPVLAPAEPERVVCQAWEKDNGAPAARTHLLIGHRLPIPANAVPTTLATADGDGPGLDQVYFAPGTGEYVVGIGNEADARSFGQQFYVSDTGERFHIKDFGTAQALGVTGWEDPERRGENHPQDAPWAVLSLLPPGPDLSQQAALIAHDGMSADPAGTKVEPPKR